MARKRTLPELAASMARYPQVHQWIPTYVISYARERTQRYIHTPRATYAQLCQSRAAAGMARDRAGARRQMRACSQHIERIEMLDRVLEVFGALMAQHPTMTLAEACGDPLPPETPRVLDPPAAVPGGEHPLRRVREL